jgi:hypothetical protein
MGGRQTGALGLLSASPNGLGIAWCLTGVMPLVYGNVIAASRARHFAHPSSPRHGHDMDLADIGYR